jgi:two-component system cell cycle response regulator CpdR
MDHSGAQPRVLLADDEVLVRDLVEESLQEAGYEVVAVSSSPEAFAALEAQGDFVAVVTDINFGAAPPGWEVAVRAREGRPNIAVVYMTGDSGHEWSAHGVPQSTIITKPFAPSQIAVAVASLLNKTDGGSAL